MSKYIFLMFLLFATTNSQIPKEKDDESKSRIADEQNTTITEELRGSCTNANESLQKAQDELLSVRRDLFLKTAYNNEILNQLDLAQNEIEQLKETIKLLLRRNKYPTLCIPDDGESNTRTISLSGHNSFPVLCNNEGWIVVLNRTRINSAPRHRWLKYVGGFGDFSDDFFLGLKYLHLITSAQQHELLISLKDFNDNSVHAHYSDFKVAEDHRYNSKLISLGTYYGDAGDGLQESVGFEFHNPYFFTQISKGWWDSPDSSSNLHESVIKWNNKYYKSAKMMIRPVTSN